MNWERHTIYHGTPAERVLLVTGDLDADGRQEVVVGSRRGADGLYWLSPRAGGDWACHLMDDGYPSLEAGGCLYDLTGDGHLDFIGGGDYQTRHVSWWECPADPTRRWTRRLIMELPGTQCHDQIVADLDGDGRPELYVWNQGARSLFGVPVPQDPTVSPWPGAFVVAEDLLEEGLAVADVDGDGRPELIAGLSWYRIDPGRRVTRHPYAEGYASPRLAVADFDGDGRVEIAIAEGDASYRRHDADTGRVVHLRPGDDPAGLWHAEVLHAGLADPHSLAVGDFDGDGRPDLFVGELGSPKGEDPWPPAQRIYLNQGGRLRERTIDTGLGTHEAKTIRLDGRDAIVGKPYRGLGADAPRSPEIDGVHLWIPDPPGS